MLSKEMETETILKNKTEKKRKKDATPKSSKKQKIADDKLSNKPDEQSDKFRPKLKLLEFAKHIEEQYEIADDEKINLIELHDEIQIYTENLSGENRRIEAIKEQLLNELEKEKALFDGEELNENVDYQEKLDVVEAIKKIEERYEQERTKTINELIKEKMKKTETNDDTQNKPGKKISDDEAIRKIKQHLLNELENEELRIQELNKALMIKHKIKTPEQEAQEKKCAKILDKKKAMEMLENQKRLEQKEAKERRRQKTLEKIIKLARLEDAEIEKNKKLEEVTEKKPIELTEEQQKKISDFDGKKFRQLLRSKQSCYEALNDFNELCSFESADRDIALEYLENGGNTSEIIRVVDIAETATPSFLLPVVEALTVVCFKIISAHPQKQHESEETCREFINKHFSLIKGMLGLSASSKQRKSTLKMLSVMVSLSATTAKEILSHAVFDPAVMELLCQPSNLHDGSNVRTHFIHFLMSFLADGHSDVIIAFLEKRTLLTSILPALIYDPVEIVNLVLSMMQEKILKDRTISKTIKMNFFNTQTIQTIVNVFNWVGPRAWNSRKREPMKVAPDPAKHTVVCEIVQKFLICLCASKNGVIFFDPSVGSSSKIYNHLLLTVLKNLPKPWMDLYKKELVVKMCVACPDIFKSVLNSVEGFLEPRASDNWFNAVHFVTEIMESLSPVALEIFLVKLQPKQVSAVMQCLCVPRLLLSKIVDGLAHEDIQIRHEFVHLLDVMLNSAQRYIEFFRNIPDFNINLVNKSFSAYLVHNLPSGSVLLKDWYNSIKATRYDSIIDQQQLNVYLTKLLNVLYQYNMFCPGWIENITQDINVKKFLQTIDVLSKNDETSYDLHIKAINLLISCDITIFAPSNEFFLYAVPLLFKFYYHTEGNIQIVIENMLFTLFKLTSIFDCCLDEIMMWLYSILEQPTFDKKLAKFLTEALIKTHNDFLTYSYKMTSLKEQITEGYNYRVIIENLSHETKNTLKLSTQSKHRILSPFILGYLDLLTPEQNPSITSYTNISVMNLLHYQTNPTILVNIILQEEYTPVVGPNLHKYISNIKLNKKISIKKDLTPEDTIPYKLVHFLTKEDISTMPQLIDYCTEHSKYYTKTIMTNLIIFYFTQKSDSLTSISQTKYYELLLYIIKTSNEKYLKYCLKSILDHPLMLNAFNPVYIDTESSKLSTKLITDIIKELLKTKTKAQLDVYLCNYQTKLVVNIYKLLVNYSENTVLFQIKELMDIIQLFDLSHDNRSDLLDVLSKIPVSSFKTDKTKSIVVLKLHSFILGHESNYSNFKPFSNEILKQINQQMIELNSSELNLEEVELNLYNYIQKFPHINVNFNEVLFESLITKSNVSKSSARLAAILLQNNHKYLEVFTKHLDKIYEKRELVFSLTNCIMDVKTESVKSLLEKVYKQYEQVIMKYLHKPQKAANYLIENYQVIIKLVTEQLKPESCKEFCAKNHKFDATEIHHFETLTTIFNKVILEESNEDLKQKYILNYVTTAMNLLINLLKRPTKTEDDWNKGEKVAKHFCTYIIKIKNVYKIDLKEEKLYSGAVFQTFAKLCLKFGLQEKPLFVNVLRHLCALTSEISKIADLGVLFEMAISHSESLNILLSEDEKKAPLLGLLLAICKRCKSCMIKSHIPIWLAAYEATLSECDQYLLQLLSLYERANIGFHQYRPYLWGKAAVAHYSVRSSIESTLWRQPRPKDVLDLFNENRIVYTIQHFPLARKLQNHSLYSDSDIEVYDPAFYLPLLSHLFAPESTIRWYQCSQRGIISLPIIALTSEDEEVRAAACNVLARFHGHLEAATYAKQRFLWLHLVEAVCRGTSILPSLRPSTIVAIFLARCSIVFSQPEHPLYSSLGNYISARECPDFNVVPELLGMLHSTNVNHIEHRNFILEVIRDGLCTEEDLKVLYKSVAFKLIMNLYNSVLIDHEGKKLILEILAAAMSLQNGARTLISGYNIISWLHVVLQQLHKNTPELVVAFVKIINNLVTCFEDDLFKHLQFNILLLLVSVIDTFKYTRLDVMHLVKFIQVLYKVYDKKESVLTKEQLLTLLSTSSALMNCQVCNYYLEFGVDFVSEPVLASDDVETVGCYYLKLLTLKWIHTNKGL